jgi:hypothetical protein
MFSERGQRIPGWAPVKQWTEGPTALRERLGHRHHALPGCRSRTQLPAVGPAIPKARRELRRQRVCLGTGVTVPRQPPDPPYTVGVLRPCSRAAMPPPPSARRASHHNRKWPALFDDLVGDREQSVRHVEAERFRGLEVDDKLVLDRLLDRQIG